MQIRAPGKTQPIQYAGCMFIIGELYILQKALKIAIGDDLALQRALGQPLGGKRIEEFETVLEKVKTLISGSGGA